MKSYDFLVVGAGLAGATVAERLASQLGASVLVVEKKDHVAGLCYDHVNEDGILVHRYGPHIFHTRSAAVWEYLSRFTEWHPYEHRVRAEVDGRLVPMPINLDTVNAIHGTSLTAEELPAFLDSVREPIDPVRNAADVVVSRVGRLLYEKLFRGYTLKQWGVPAEELAPEVTRRIPVRMNRDDRYFDDPYQGLPRDGYTRMVERMLDRPGIDLRLGLDYKDAAADTSYGGMVYTGPIDCYFDFELGRLPYRTVVFEHKTHRCARYQAVAQVNYPGDDRFTRITEFRHMTGQISCKTSTATEYPRTAAAEDEPCYPVPTEHAAAMARAYDRRTRQLIGVAFVGRLAEYRYYNMDVVVDRALSVSLHIAKTTRENRGA